MDIESDSHADQFDHQDIQEMASLCEGVVERLQEISRLADYVPIDDEVYAAIMKFAVDQNARFMGYPNLPPGLGNRFKPNGSCLHKADLRGTELCGASLVGASLFEANLGHADLSSAILRDANLSGARLERANLSNADLTGANLSGAILPAPISYAPGREASQDTAPGLRALLGRGYSTY